MKLDIIYKINAIIKEQIIVLKRNYQQYSGHKLDREEFPIIISTIVELSDLEIKLIFFEKYYALKVVDYFL